MTSRAAPAGRGVSLAVLALAFAFVYRDVISGLVTSWRLDGNYSHGFLVVPIAAYLAWLRRDRLGCPDRPSLAGLAVVVLSLGVLAVGVLGAERFLTRVSMIGTVAGTVLFVHGRQHLRILLFPIAFLLLMIPVPAILFNQVTLPLQLLASQVGQAALSGLGVPVLREGNVMTLSTITLEVAEACSGIRSLVSLLMLTVVYGCLAERRSWVRAALAVSSVPIAILANAARVAGTGLAAEYAGPEAARGYFHEFSGWLVFVAALAATAAFHHAITRLVPPERAVVPRTGMQGERLPS